MSRVRVLLVIFVLLLATIARAEEPCPGCGGGGKVGCPGCASPYSIYFIGKCSGCQGFYGWMNKGTCKRCGGTGTCTVCGGQGAACMGCKGSGQVPDGTTAALAASRAKEEKEAIDAAMKPLAYLAGTWKGEGTSEGKAATAELQFERAGALLRITERERVGDELSEAAGVVAFDPAHKVYSYYILLSEGRGVVLRSKTVTDDEIVFATTTQDGQEVRVVWKLDAFGKRFFAATEIVKDELGPQRLAEMSFSRGGAAPARSGTLAKTLEKLAFLKGSWKSQNDEGGKKSTSTIQWEPVASGSWLRCHEKDSTGQEYEAAVTCDGEKLLFLQFSTSGKVFVFSGETSGSETSFTSVDGLPVRFSWTASGKTLETKVEVKQGDEWKLAAHARATHD